MRSFRPIGEHFLVTPCPEDPDILIGVKKESLRKGVIESKSRLFDQQAPHEKDVVLFPRGAGKPQVINGFEYLIISIHDIIAEV